VTGPVADNRSYQYRHQRPIFHTADCQHFESENGACQRCAENGPETCGNTRHQDDAGTRHQAETSWRRRWQGCRPAAQPSFSPGRAAEQVRDNGAEED
jgi:hypothetical protein